jgi:hemerythrin-like metal-binding protein
MSDRIWKVEWNDTLSFGRLEIDEEHKCFIDLINRFNEAVTNRRELTDVVNTINDMVDFVDYHFTDEEELYDSVGYPDADEHKRKHAELRQLLAEILSHAKHEASEYVLIEAGLNIKEQIVDHLLNEDAKYAEYYRNNRS